MKKVVKTQLKKRVSVVLTGAMVVSASVPSLGNIAESKKDEAIELSYPAVYNEVGVERTSSSVLEVDTLESQPEQNQTYNYNFKKEANALGIPTTGNIGTVVTPDGLLTINGGGTMSYHGSSHGLLVKDGNSFQVKVAGNAKIRFELCQYSNTGTISASSATGTGKFSSEGKINLQVAQDKDIVEMIYVGEATTLTFTVETTGSGYIHSLEVQNTDEALEIKSWAQKDFSINIGDKTLELKGASAQDKAAEVTLEGTVYYAQSEKAYVSMDLTDNALAEENLSFDSDSNTVESVALDENGDIVVTFKDKDTNPATYTIKIQDTSQFNAPTKTDSYSFDFTGTSQSIPQDFSGANPITASYTTDDGILTLSKGEGSKSPYWHDAKHGLALYDKNSFEIKVAGNAIITLGLCGEGSGGNLKVAPATSTDGELSSASIGLKVAEDGDTTTINYVGGETTLTFTVEGSGYLHSVDVQNTTEDLKITPWVQKDFSINIAGVEVSVTGAATNQDKATATVTSGDVYYALSEKAYVSIDLAGCTLTNEKLSSNSESVESVTLDENGDILVTFSDKDSDPATYTIKVQDKSQFKTPTSTDTYSFDFTGKSQIIPQDFSSNNPIATSYTTDDGILTLSKGDGSKSPYWHDSTHGLALCDGNTIDVAVAGDAEITFSACEYGSGGTLTVSNLASNGKECSFAPSNEMKAKKDEDGATITYTYKGDAATLRFTLASQGEAYLHSITVINKGELKGSEVAHEQEAMPEEIDSSDSLTVTPVGQKLNVVHSNNDASIETLKNVGYYVFAPSQETYSIEADIKVVPLASGSKNGLFVGMFDDQTPITLAATLGFRGDATVRNMLTKATDNKVSAGGINTTYNTGESVHVIIEKRSDGWYSKFTQGNSIPQTKKYEFKDAKLLKVNGIDTNVRFGFAFSNVQATITNLIFKDNTGNVLYDQTDCYDAIGTPPNITEVETPVISKDRTTISVSWEGDTVSYDAAYQVELSKDGGKTYTLLSKQVTEKTYTVPVDGDGDYIFRITGVCGEEVSESKLSPSVPVIAPLESPVITAESGDATITLNWNAVEEATSYEVYRKYIEDEEYTLIATVDKMTYVDQDVINEEPYYYYILAKSEGNESNPSNTLLMVPSAGREGKYVYENEAANLFITKKSYDTVYKNEATLEGVVDRAGTLSLEVNGTVQDTVSVDKKGNFAFKANLEAGRNDVNLLLTDEAGKVTRKTFNFVYLTNYDIVVDQAYTGVEGAEDAATGAKMYSTVQKAVDSVSASNTERVVILVKEGNYTEHLRITSPYITLIGEDSQKVNINYYDKDESPEGGDTSLRCAVYVKESATGFAAENLTFENTYQYLGDGTKSNESADALRVDADEATFVNVRLLGYQDTLYACKNKQYYYKCYILGNVDFIYGAAQALFNDCEIVFRYNSKKNSGYVTAPKTAADKAYGYIFKDSVIYSEEGCSGSKYLLARPWGPDGAATFINTYMGEIINKVTSYADMSGNSYEEARFNEYYSYGPGYAINSERPQISKTQAENMLTPAFLGWTPDEVSEGISNSHFVGSVVTEGEEKFVQSEFNDETADPDSTDDTGLGAYTIEGYANQVTGGGVQLESSTNYYQVSTAEAFLEALTTIKESGKASVIELAEDINLGSKEIGDALTKYSSVIKANSHTPLLHPILLETGVSTLSIKDMSNLTIYSKNGSAIKHTCIDISNSSNVIIRNIVFDEIWEWDEDTNGDYDRNDWDYMTIQNGSNNIWVDHCTFYKAYDGIIDVKKANSNAKTNVTISWCKFLPESESDFFDQMMDLLEANPEAYPYYHKLITEYGMTKEQVRGYASMQKKTHLIGASDTEANIENLQVTLANNYYKNSMDRMPRMRGGDAHVYNCILDASEIYALKTSITNPEAATKIVSNGAISTCNGSVLLENTYIDGIINPLISGNGSSPGGYMNAINSVYYLNGELADLVIKDLTVGPDAVSDKILDADKFISELPYSNYKLYAVSQLDTKVLPNVGAGVIDMNSIQWQKTTYNDLSDGNEEETAKEYTVTLNYQGATSNNTVEQVKVTVGKPYGNLPTPERSGYTFLGWYTDVTDGEKVLPTTVVTKEEDHVLYARWSIISSDSQTPSKPEGSISSILDKLNDIIKEHLGKGLIEILKNLGVIKGNNINN